MSERSSASGTGNGRPDIDNLSGAYALNALSDEERQAFEARIVESDEIRTEVAELNETALLLGHAVEPVTPSPALRSSIMDLLDSTPQLPALTNDESPERTESATSDPASEAPSAPSEAETRPGEILEPTPLARQRWFLRPSALLAAAAAAVALFVGGPALINGIAPQPSPTSSNQAIGDVSSILTASDVQHTVSSVATGGKATLYWSNDLKRSAVILDGVSALPSNKTYELWYINGSSIRSAGTVGATSNTVTQVLQGDMTKGDVIGMTVEPAGGSKQPTTKPIVTLQSA